MQIARHPLTGHSGGNDRFCARLKTDISAFSSGLQGHMRSCLTILDSSWRPLSKNVRHDLVRPRRPELEAEMSVFNLAQKRSFPPLCARGRRKPCRGARGPGQGGRISYIFDPPAAAVLQVLCYAVRVITRARADAGQPTAGLTEKQQKRTPSSWKD
jgi:hypothetical protein